MENEDKTGDAHKTKEQLMQELAEMRQEFEELEKCKKNYKEVQEKYRKLLDSAPDAMVFVNKKGNIVTTNAQFENLFGYTHEEVADRKLDILIPERFRNKHLGHVAAFFTEPKAHPMGEGFEIYAVRKNGGEFPVTISLNLLHTEGEMLVTAAIRDITRRKEAEEKVELNYHIQRVLNSMLKVSLEQVSLEEQFERILDLILSIPYLSLQSKGAIYLVKDKLEILVLKAHRGLAEDEIGPCDNIPFGKCLCGQAASLQEVIYSEQLDGRHDIHHEGMFPHGHYCVPIVSGGQALGLINIYVKEGHKRSSGEEQFLTAVASTLASIIKHDALDKEKKGLQAELAQAEKLAALGRFTANVAHEIRNPLTAIGGFARRLDKSIPGGSKEKEYAGFIITEATRLEGILKNVLAFSRDLTLHLEEYVINEIADRILQIHEEKFTDKAIRINRKYDEEKPVLIDGPHVYEALENLVLNAVDSMPEGGTLTISTGRKLIESIPFMYVEIRDTGTGIPHELIDIIFEPFYTTKIAEKGTGLGLSITKKVIEEHGGFIRVESTPGKGSSFTLFFPFKL